MPTAGNVLCGCGRFMRVTKNSVTVEELDEAGTGYKLWDADRYGCAECGAEIITGFGREPFAEHWQPSYAMQRERLAPIYPGRCMDKAEPNRCPNCGSYVWNYQGDRLVCSDCGK